MERYYNLKNQLNMNPTPTLRIPPTNNDSVLSEFDHYHLTLLLGQEGEGWQAELR
jgi:hypothetical protein